LPLLASPTIEALLGSLAAACLASSRSSLQQRRSVNSAAAELESTAAEVDPAVADLKSAAAEVESRGAGAPISGGGGRIDGGGVDLAAAVLQSAAEPESTAVSNLARAGLISFCSPSCCTASALFVAGPYRQARHVSDGVSNICENNKKSDTPRIRIQGILDTYPYPIRIGYAIRGFRDVSV
jgi:hypothetical protein